MRNKYTLLIAFLFFFYFSSGQSLIFSEDFDGASLSVTASTSGTGATWDLCSTFKKSGSNSDSVQVVLNDSLFLQTDTINTSSYSFIRLEFSHICKIDFFDKAIIQYSTDSGLTWNALSTNEYLGAGTMFQGGFSSISYTDWLVASSTAIPTQNWWNTEIFNLDAAAGYKNVIIRFVLIDTDNNGPVNNYGWIVDDIEVTASSCELNPPAIQLTGNIQQGVSYSTGPFNIEAIITDTSGIAEAFIVYQVNNGADDTISMYLGSNGRFNGTIPSATVGDTLCYLVYARDSSACSNLGVLQVSSCMQIIIKTNPAPTCRGTTISTFDYIEDFSGFTVGNRFNPIGTLKSNWQNATGDDHDWYVYDRATPSRFSQTGPADDHSDNDDQFLYIEASGHTSETASIVTPCFDLSNLELPELRYWYHMYGANMGELHLDVYYGGQWVNDIVPYITGDQGDNWIQQVVDLTPYGKNTIKFRFRGITGSGFRSDIAIDDIELLDLPFHNVEVKNLLSPSKAACSGSATEQVTVTIANVGGNAMDSIPLNYQVNGGAIITDTVFGVLNVNDTLNFTFTQTFNMSVSGRYSIDVWSDHLLDSDFSNDSLLNNSLNSSSLTSQFPDTTNFDNFTSGVPGLFLDDWANNRADGHDWYVISGTTPSSFTGPNGDHTSGNGLYVYMEASGISLGTESILESKCYDLSNLNKAELEFAYHMNGADMGDLHLDVLNNGILTEDIINPITGNQGSSWKSETVNLSSYSGKVKLLFRASCGTGYRSDIAIDDVIVRDAQPVGINENRALSDNFKVYPNPTSDYLFINSIENKPFELLVYNSFGKLIVQEVKNGTNNKIDIINFAAGIYFVSLKTANGIQTFKVIKQ